MQHARNLEFVTVLLAHVEVSERPFSRLIDGFGKHHGEHRDTLAVSAGILGLLVDRGVDELDERLEQLLQLIDEVAIGERDGGVRCKRFRQARVRMRERPDLVRRRIYAVDELKHADYFDLVVLHRQGEERLRAVSGLPVEIARSGEIETLLRIRINDIHRLPRQSGVSGDHLVVGRSVLSVEVHRIERYRGASGAAHRDAHRLVSQDRKSTRLNSSHSQISYAVFCLKKNAITEEKQT